MEYLNSDQITKETKKYLESSFFQYALMINGPWGCGKSYLVNNKLKKEIEETELQNDKKVKHYKYLYISLYGVKEISELERMIATKIILQNKILKSKRLNVFKKFKNKGKILGDVGGVGLQICSSATSYLKVPIHSFFELIPNIGNKIPKFIYDAADLKQYVFIFDDFERTAIPLNEIFGFISNLIEIDRAKVIIVANEDEIKDIRDEKSDYQKYFWYLLVKDKISIPKDPTALFVHKQNSGVPAKKPDFDVIMHEAERLFKSKAEYETTKEKVIGKTLNYQQDESEIKFFIEEKIKQWNESQRDSVDKKVSLGDLSAFIAQQFNKKKCYNLRAVQKLLSYLFIVIPQIQEMIFEKFQADGEDASADRVFKDIIANITDILMDNVNGTKYEESMRAPNLEYEFVNSNRKRDFRFAADYFYFGVQDETKLKKDLIPFIELKWMSKSDPNHPLYKLSQFYLKEESEMREIINEVEQGIDSGKIRVETYGEALSYISTLETIQVIQHYKVEEIIGKMVIKIEDNKIFDLGYNDGYVNASSEEVRYKYEGYLNILQEAAKKNSRNPTIKKLIEGSLAAGILCSDEVSDFYVHDLSTDDTSYFRLVDIKKLAQVIKDAKAKDILELRRIAHSINESVTRFPKSEIPIKELYDQLEGMVNKDETFHDRISTQHVKLLIKELREILNQYKFYKC